jgi:hypothetical protein
VSHLADCVVGGVAPEATVEEARGDIALLHRIFGAIGRPLA